MNSYQNEFTGKKVLITGGTKGLGLSVAKLFAQNGCDVFLTYRSDDESAKSALEQIKSLGVHCELIRADLSEENGINQVFDAYQMKSDQLDFYVHNAAATAFKSLLDLKPHHIDKTFNISVKGFILGVQRATSMMKPGSAILTVSGMDTLKAVPFHGLLGAAKSALETLTQYFAHELASKQIRVNGVNPGFLATDSTRKYLGSGFEKVNLKYAEATPFKREARLDEIAEVILFLASKKSSWIVGQTLCVDGGFDFSLNIK